MNLEGTTMKKNLFAVFVVIIVVLAGYAFFIKSHSPLQKSTTVKSSIIIGFSLGTVKEERWQRDLDFFTKRAEALGANVNVQIANADSTLQQSQIESFILQNVPVLVVVPQEDKAIAPLVTKARQKGIKVIAYDRLINDTALDAYVTVDYVKAGEQQAQGVLNVAKKGNIAIIMGASDDSTVYMQKDGISKVLQPQLDNGSIHVVYQDFTDSWKPEVAYQHMATLLSKGTKIDGVISMNDGMAGGIIQSLKEHGLAGKIPISGMDAELAGCQRIVDGTQTQTTYLPINLQAEKAAEVAVALAQGNTFAFNGSTKNGTVEIPTYFVQPVSVTKENMMDTIIKDGFHSYAEVYQNVPVKNRPQQ